MKFFNRNKAPNQSFQQLKQAIKKGEELPEDFLSKLEDKDLEYYQVDNKGNTVSHVLAKNNKFSENNPEISESIIEKTQAAENNLLLSRKNNSGETPLQLADKNKNNKIGEEILKQTQGFINKKAMSMARKEKNINLNKVISEELGISESFFVKNKAKISKAEFKRSTSQYSINSESLSSVDFSAGIPKEVISKVESSRSLESSKSSLTESFDERNDLTTSKTNPDEDKNKTPKRTNVTRSKRENKEDLLLPKLENKTSLDEKFSHAARLDEERDKKPNTPQK
jgi:hypothetical protein